MADEARFLELLVANEKVGRLLDVLCDPFQRPKHRHVLVQLQQDLQRGASYVEEANRLGAVQTLTKLLSTTHDEGMLELISSIIAACSGPMACGGKVTTFTYGDLAVHIREGALGDGLGAKVWSVCHILARELLAHPEICRGQLVLELGSGTGLIGLVAALSGAQQVLLTDHEEPVLLNLRTCMHMNTAAAAAAAAAASAAKQPCCQEAPGEPELAVPDDAELFDDAESVASGFDLADLVSGLPGSSDGGAAAVVLQHASQQTAWEADNMAVRALDWQESEAALVQQQQQQDSPQQQQQQNGHTSSSSSPAAPGVPLQQRFPVVLGNEVMYERAHARLVAAAIRHRLAPGGRALLCCAVRDQAVFDAFAAACARWGLRYRAARVAPQDDRDLGGIAGRAREYEGYLLMAVDHAAAPAADWHRADFVAVP